VNKLAAHFNVQLDDDQINIFVHALRNSTVYQVEHAFERCLNECEFMPKLSDVHKRMSDQRYPAENPAAYVLNGPPIQDLVRPFAEEAAYKIFGKPMQEIEGIQLMQCWAEGNRIRLLAELGKRPASIDPKETEKERTRLENFDYKDLALPRWANSGKL